MDLNETHHAALSSPGSLISDGRKVAAENLAKKGYLIALGQGRYERTPKGDALLANYNAGRR
jgi:hypothetical protein